MAEHFFHQYIKIYNKYADSSNNKRIRRQCQGFALHPNHIGEVKLAKIHLCLFQFSLWLPDIHRRWRL